MTDHATCPAPAPRAGHVAAAVVAAYIREVAPMNAFALARPAIERARQQLRPAAADVCLAQFMVILDVSIVNVALPSIRGSLHFSTAGLQWVVNAYTLTFAGFLMLGGRASDLFGRRRVLLAGISAVHVRLARVRAERLAAGC